MLPAAYLFRAASFSAVRDVVSTGFVSAKRSLKVSPACTETPQWCLGHLPANLGKCAGMACTKCMQHARSTMITLVPRSCTFSSERYHQNVGRSGEGVTVARPSAARIAEFCAMLLLGCSWASRPVTTGPILDHRSPKSHSDLTSLKVAGPNSCTAVGLIVRVEFEDSSCPASAST